MFDFFFNLKNKGVVLWALFGFRLLACGFVSGWHFLLSKGAKIKNRPCIYAEKTFGGNSKQL